MPCTVWATEGADYKAFFDAVTNGHLQEVKASLNSSINLDALLGDGLDGYAALHIAVTNNHIEVVRLLLARGAFVDVLAMSRFGSNTPLHLAAQHARPTLVKLLLDHGAKPNTTGEIDGTPLHMVLFHTLRVYTAHIETIKLLLDCGAEIGALAEEMGGTVVSH
jgi:ankyrin repeat protein